MASNACIADMLRSAGRSWQVVGVVFVILCLTDDGSVGAGSGVPCTYEGHLKTDKSWYGYLANISIITTGRMTFQFSYQAERCCQNILFYSEDQMAIINARMNCWQKEYLLRPEEDQILRLTPRFSWSGCHVTTPNGVSTYVCEGGRSFTIDQPTSGPITWYIAVSNCAALQGLDLQYRLVIYGHVGECRSGSTHSSPGSSGSGSAVANPRSVLMPKNSDPMTSSDSSCVIEGKLNASSNWYGFLTNITFARGGGLQFQFTYPATRQTQNVLLYSEEDLKRLNPGHNCWQREGIIHPNNRQEQILDLSFKSSWNGCVSKEGRSASDVQLSCQGSRWYDKPWKMFMAVSNCLSHTGLILHYHLEVYGYTNDICSLGVDQMRRQRLPLVTVCSFLSLVVCSYST